MCAKKAKTKKAEEEEADPLIALRETWLEWRRSKDNAAGKSRDRMKDAMPFLSAIGVARIEFSYDGSGDSGDFTDIEIHASPDTKLSEEDFDRRLAKLDQTDQPFVRFNIEQLKDYAFEFLPGGWEINEGSYGEVVVNVLENTIKVQHHERYIEESYNETMWRLSGDV